MSKLAHLCKERIARDLGYENWIKQFVTVESVSENGEARHCCIAHSEETSSASFNVNSGLWKCQSVSCGEAGDAIDFYYFARQCESKADAVRRLALELKLICDISEGMVQAMHQRLMENEKLRTACCEMLGVREEALTKFKLGFIRQEKEAYFTIPVKGLSGTWEDLRKYNRNYKPKIKSWAAGHGEVRIWPLETFQAHDDLIVLEGEKDVMRAWCFGIGNAITFTGGAGHLPEGMGELAKGKTFRLCYDIDKAGREGAETIARRLAPYAAGVWIVQLPSQDMPGNGDFSDWANLGHTPEEWQALLAEAVLYEPVGGRFDPALNEDEPREVSFNSLRQALDLYNVPIRFVAHAMGSSVGLVNYQVPTQVLADCPRNQKKLCDSCALFHLDAAQKPWTIPINYKTETSLQLFRVSEQQQGEAIRRLTGIHKRCSVLRLQTTARRSLQHLLLSPPVELSSMREMDSGGFITAYYHGEPITDNRDYWFEGYLQADPKTQSAVLNLFKAEPARNAIENFMVTEETFEAIDWFKPKAGRTIAEHFRELHGIIEEDIGIWGQYGLQHAYLEAIFSVLEFSVGDRRVESGWNQILIVGDTGLAKTTVGRRMMEMIDVGELISGENVTVAGLIGGIEYIDKVALTKWGALPRNDRGFVVLDEVDEMQRRGGRDITGQLTALRSSGWAEITKIAHARTPARVRMVWITNPQNARPIASYNGGCRAIEGVIQGRADVARFTKCYAVASDSISVETITQKRARVERPGVRRQFNTLAILTWSLAHEQVEFTAEARALLSDEVVRLTGKYHESIPFLEKGRALDKLSKLAVPIAVLCGSFQQREGELVLVIDRAHVRYAIQHLEETYDDPAMGYDAYSLVEYEREQIADPVAVQIALEAVREVPLAALLRYFLVHSTFTRNSLDELVGNRIAAYELWSKLLANNCLSHTQRQDTAMKTAAFAGLVEAMLCETVGRKSKKRKTSV